MACGTYAYHQTLAPASAVRYPHEVLGFHQVITDSEAQQLIDLALPKMAHASVGQQRSLSEIRVSRTAWLDDDVAVVKRISRRLDLITGLQTTRCFDRFGEGRQDEYEMLQVKRNLRNMICSVQYVHTVIQRLSHKSFIS